MSSLRSLPASARLVSCFHARLPKLTSLSLQNTVSLQWLQTFTQLTQITISEPAYVPELQPLAALRRLRSLHLGSVELGSHPSFSSLTQLSNLALFFCDQQGRKPLGADEVNELIAQDSLQQLQLEALSLAGRTLGTFSAFSVFHLAGMTRLRVLDLRESRMIGALADGLDRWRSLRLLAVSKRDLPTTLSSKWRLSRTVDTHLPSEEQLKAPGATFQSHSSNFIRQFTECLGVVLQNTAHSGKISTDDAADEERMLLFDSFFHEHTRWVIYSGGANLATSADYNDDHIDDDDEDDEAYDHGAMCYPFSSDAHHAVSRGIGEVDNALTHADMLGAPS
ncbi:hypothetical protein WJX73_001967 [Symbiochloris irregularis]|uniref:Uncharacterized protein n=1 Tax=Symbiochloris irregularis TaxID=706552 RepID=A0AAW1P1W6_9CHLO